MKNHEIDYKISGEELQCLEIELDPQEAVTAEPGSFMMMTEGIEMQTMFGDGSNQGGFMGKLFTAGKRLLTGDKFIHDSVFERFKSKTSLNSCGTL